MFSFYWCFSSLSWLFALTSCLVQKSVGEDSIDIPVLDITSWNFEGNRQDSLFKTTSCSRKTEDETDNNDNNRSNIRQERKFMIKGWLERQKKKEKRHRQRIRLFFDSILCHLFLSSCLLFLHPHLLFSCSSLLYFLLSSCPPSLLLKKLKTL